MTDEEKDFLSGSRWAPDQISEAQRRGVSPLDLENKVLRLKLPPQWPQQIDRMTGIPKPAPKAASSGEQFS